MCTHSQIIATTVAYEVRSAKCALRRDAEVEGRSSYNFEEDLSTNIADGRGATPEPASHHQVSYTTMIVMMPTTDDGHQTPEEDS